MSGSEISKVKRLLHWGPTLALSIITTISLCTINSILVWWPPFSSAYATVNMAVYMMWNILVLFNFFNAAFIGPGHVPPGWKPKKESDIKHLQFCSFCNSYKAPRSHHCRKCNKCVMKMDHHCPWINNCVGAFNHASFTYFLAFAPCGCIHSLCILIPTMYRALNRHYYLLYRMTDVPIVVMSVRSFVLSLLSVSLAIGVIVAVGGLCYIQRRYLIERIPDVPLVHLSGQGILVSMFATGLAGGVIIAVGVLCYLQVKTILKNETGIESWIIEKAEYREREEDEDPDEEFVFPYNLGRWENWRQVFSWDMSLRRDGIWWPVVEGCDQYTLTVEQIKQKREKKDRTVLYTIRDAYSGAIFPISKGFKVCCRPPFTDEPRIPLKVGDQVRVTRWKRHWLYGDKVLAEAGDANQGPNRVRGWFPRKCAVEVVKNPPEANDSAAAGDVKSKKKK